MPPNPGAKKMAGYTSYSLVGILASHEDLLISLARGITVIDCSVDMACVLGLSTYQDFRQALYIGVVSYLHQGTK